MRPLPHLALPLVLLPWPGSTIAAQTQWRQTTAAIPLPASWHASAYDARRQRVVVFGGNDRTLTPVNSLMEWDGTAWAVREVSPPPPARSALAMAYDTARERCVVFGGVDTMISARAETFEWDGTTWTQKAPPQSPLGRFSMAMVYDEARAEMVLFGGVTSSGEVQETWTYDGVTWVQKTTSRRPPVATGHRMVYDRRRQLVVLFGGELAGTSTPSNETWTWDGTDWARLALTGSPPAREQHAMAYDAARDRVIVFGGQGELFMPPFYKDDTWEWDGTEWRARVLNPRPNPRALLAASYDEAREQIVMLSGWSGSVSIPNRDTWLYEPTVPASVTAFGTGCAGTVGLPVLAAEAGSRPWAGSTFALAVSGAGPGAAVLVLGASDSTWRTLSLPLPLASAGAPGCSLLVSLDVVVPIGAGGRVGLTLPATPVLTGGVFFGQAVVADAGANPLGLVFSGGLGATVGSL
ncbi:MAG: kelch repeat-containing protein [Planctomycetota bacterium]